MDKICCIFNYAPHYRIAIYKLMEEELDCDFYFGNNVRADLRKIDYSTFKNPVKELQTRWFLNKMYWISGSVSLLFKPYDKYFLTGEINGLSNWVILLLAKILGKKTYVWSHGWYGKEGRVRSLIKKVFFLMVDEVFLYGNHAKILMIKQGINENKLHVIYNSLDYDKAFGLRDKLRQSDIFTKKFSNDYPVLVFIGRLEPKKKIDLVIRAIEVLQQKNIFLNLVIVGEGSERENLELTAAKYNLKDRVWFYGPSYDESVTGELIFNSSICVSPGNVGLTAIHSLSFGTPVITQNNFSKQMPEFEAIENGQTGAFYLENNLVSMADTIQKWLEDHPVKSQQLVDACYAKIDNFYNPSYQLQVLKNVLAKDSSFISGTISGEQKKMRIVHIEDFFHPDAGYQINMLAKYQSMAGKEVIIITADMNKIPERLKGFFGSKDIEKRDEEYSRKFNVKIVRLHVYGYYSGRALYKFGFLKYIKSLNPDLVYVHGNDSYAGISISLKIKKLNFAVIFDNHMLEMATKNPFHKIFRWGYKKFISPIVIKNNLKVIRVVEDEFVIKRLGIPSHLAPVIPFGTDTMQFKPDENVNQTFRVNHNIPMDAFVVLYMGKLTADKGVMLLAEAFKEQFKNNREVVLVMVGNTSSEYGRFVMEELKLSGNRIFFFPTQRYTELAQFYQMADLSVFPKHCSLSFYDAQSCGVPVLLENNNINNDRLKFNNGLIFRAEDASDLRDKLNEMATLETEKYNLMRNAALEYIKQNDFDYTRIIAIYDSILDDTMVAFKKSKVNKI